MSLALKKWFIFHTETWSSLDAFRATTKQFCHLLLPPLILLCHLTSPPLHPVPTPTPTTPPPPPPPPGSPPKTPTICCFGVWLDDFFCQLWSSTLTMMFWLFPPNSVNFLQTPLSNIWCSYFYQHQAMTICYIETLVLKSYMSTIYSR